MIHLLHQLLHFWIRTWETLTQLRYSCIVLSQTLFPTKLTTPFMWTEPVCQLHSHFQSVEEDYMTTQIVWRPRERQWKRHCFTQRLNATTSNKKAFCNFRSQIIIPLIVQCKMQAADPSTYPESILIPQNWPLKVTADYILQCKMQTAYLNSF